MTAFKKGLVVFLLATVLAASSWADSARTVTIPISGEYWESAAGGMLVYSGTVTIEWLTDSNGSGVQPVKATLMGQAWCKDTGAGYKLYGIASDSLSGAPGSTATLTQSLMAIGGDGKPAFNRDLSVTVALGASPTATVIAFSGN